MRERILIVDDDPLERRLSIAAAYRRPLSCVQYLHRCVAQQEIGFAGDAAKIADPQILPRGPLCRSRAGDLVVGDVIDLQAAGIGVAQEHVAFGCSDREDPE